MCLECSNTHKQSIDKTCTICLHCQCDLHNMDTLSFALKRRLAQGGIKCDDEQECKTAAQGVQCVIKAGF